MLIFIKIRCLMYKRIKIDMDKIKKYLSREKSIFYILLIAFIIRLAWILIIRTAPISDFQLMYEAGKNVANGNYSCFYGNNYFSRFPHDTITVLYYSLFFRIVKNPLFLIKFMNIIYQTFTVYMIYNISKITYNKKIANISAILITIFSPFIMYCSETMAENMAIPLFLVGVYLFIKYIDNDNILTLIFSTVFLGIGNFFRPVGIIFLIAFILYYITKKIIYYKSKNILKYLYIFIIIIGFLMPKIIISNLLVTNNILEKQLWNGGEPVIMNILKGTNLDSIGAWSEEDSLIPEESNHNNELMKEKAIERIKSRFTNSNFIQIILFYLKKIVLQWGIGDFGAYDWTVAKGIYLTPKITLFLTPIAYTISSIYYLYLISLSVIGLKNISNNKINDKVLFYYLILLGFIGFYLLTERQPRYAFVCSWIFVLTASNAFYKSDKKISKKTLISL